MTGASRTSRPRFARIWRGRTPKDKADAYERYWLDNGIAPLEAKGALGVEMLREDSGLGDRVRHHPLLGQRRGRAARAAMPATPIIWSAIRSSSSRRG